MPVYTFVEMTPVPACEHTGAYMEFLADNEEAAVSACLYSCRLSDGRANVGSTGRIVYPHGVLAQANCWVLLAPNRQKRWYAERGLPNPNEEPACQSEEEEVTPVVFRVWREDGEVLALFPTLAATGRHDVVCYAHIGQHSSADWGVCIQKSRPAKPEEYAALKTELETVGYRLKVYSRGARLLHYRNP